MAAHTTDTDDIDPRVMRELHRLSRGVDAPDITIARSAFGDRIVPADQPDVPDTAGTLAVIVAAAIGAMMLIGVVLALAGGRL
jgi:hypothetical protein